MDRALEAGVGQFEAFVPVLIPTTLDRALEGGTGEYVGNSRQVPMSLDRALEQGIMAEQFGPAVRNWGPAYPDGCVPPSGPFEFDVSTVLPATVNIASMTVVLRDLFHDTVQTVFTASAFQLGFAGVITPVASVLEDVHHVTFTAAPGLVQGDWYRLEVSVLDSNNVALAPPDTWTFSTCIVVPPVVIMAVDDFDTIRGGKAIFVTAPTEKLVDTSQDQPFTNLHALPGGWGSSGTINFLADGLELVSGPIAGGLARVQSSAPYKYFDAAIDIALEIPTTLKESSVELATFEHHAGGASATIRVDLLPNQLVQVSGSATAFGRTVAADTQFPVDRSFTLRIVRDAGRIYLFLGARGSDRAYTSSLQLLAFDQFDASTTGTFAFQLTNNDRAVDVRTLFSNFTMESHVRIGPRLLENKVVRYRRVLGTVPAATLAEVGFAELAIFGLFGESTSPTGFIYTLPPQRTLAVDPTHTFLTVQDPELKDGF
jgi:hypothetical protein